MQGDVSNLFAMAGLGADALGGFFLAKGFMAKKLKTIRREGGTYFNRNRFLRNSLIRQRAEAWAGGIFLVVGFFLQFLSYALRARYGFVDLIVTLAVLGVLAFLVLCITEHVGSRTIMKLDFAEMVGDIAEYEKRYPKQIKDNLVRWGEQVDVHRLAGESDGEFLMRIKTALAERAKYSNKTIL